MDTTIIWSVIGYTFVIYIVAVATILGMFLWVRGEANKDRMHLQSIIEAIRQDMRDFDGRLHMLEERWLNLRDK